MTYNIFIGLSVYNIISFASCFGKLPEKNASEFNSKWIEGWPNKTYTKITYPCLLPCKLMCRLKLSLLAEQYEHFSQQNFLLLIPFFCLSRLRPSLAENLRLNPADDSVISPAGDPGSPFSSGMLSSISPYTT